MEPKFKVGDVVNLIDNQSMYYVVIESILVDNGIFRRYQYEVSNVRTDDTFVYDESSLEFQYHDTSWEYYLIEGTRIYNDLPDWRGELYNFYIIYGHLRTHDDLQYDQMEDYNNDTIPPMFMEHILDGHSAFGSMNRLLKYPDKARIVMKKLNIDKDKLDKLVKSTKHKINIRNLSDFDTETKEEWRSSGKKFEFTGDELNLVAEVYKLDTEGKDEYGNVCYTNHYDIDMTNLQIMQAIKEAYGNAKRTGRMQMQPIKDRRIIKGYGDFDPEPVKPVKGKREYEGVSKKGLVIRFWYNFDLDLIETAYPVVVNNNAKKH